MCVGMGSIYIYREFPLLSYVKIGIVGEGWYMGVSGAVHLLTCVGFYI